MKYLSFILEESKKSSPNREDGIGNDGNKLIRFGLIPQNKTFVGRDKELEEIQKFYENPMIQCLVISGMGGQGKTELCRKFINNLNATCITWLNGKSLQELNSSLQKLAESLNLQ